MRRNNINNRIIFIAGWVIIAATKILEVTIGLNKFFDIGLSLLAIICFITYIVQLNKCKR